MQSEENKKLVRRFYAEVWSKGNLDTFPQFVAAGLTDHNPMNFPGRAAGMERLRQVVGMIRGAFPDLERTVEDQVAEGDKIVTRFTDRGTHLGDFMGIPATGRVVTVSGINIEQVEDNKISHIWHNEDIMGLLAQLGAIPTP